MRKALQLLLLTCLICQYGCGAHMTSYVPPSQQLVASEFHTTILPVSPDTAKAKVQQAMRQFGWLHQANGELSYSGKVENASLYADCGRILTHAPSPVGHVEYAAPKLQFMGRDTSSADELLTNLDVLVQITVTPVPEGSKVSVAASYTLNREHIVRRTIFGVESRPPEKNSPISFTTLEQGSGGDGTLCRAKLTLEHAMIRAIADQ